MAINIFSRVLNKAKRTIKRIVFSIFSYFKLLSNWNLGKSWALNNKPRLMTNQKPRLSIIIPTYKRIGAVIDAIKSIREHTNDYETIVVNSGSGFFGDLWLKRQSKIGDTIVVFDNGRRFNKRVMSQSYFYNLGYQIANGKYIIHFADDCVATKNWTQEAVEILEENENVGLSIFFGQPGYYGHYNHTIFSGKLNGRVHHYPVAHWWCGRKEEIQRIGFMSEEYKYYYNDLDMTMKVYHKLKKDVFCCENSKIIHKDKDLVYREKQKSIEDINLFNSLWKDKCGFDVSDSNQVVNLDLEKFSEWKKEKKLILNSN